MLLKMLITMLPTLTHYARFKFRQESHRLPKLNSGQGLVEYALILVLVAVVVIVVLVLVGPSLGNIFSNIVCGVLEAQDEECFGYN